MQPFHTEANVWAPAGAAAARARPAVVTRTRVFNAGSITRALPTGPHDSAGFDRREDAPLLAVTGSENDGKGRNETAPPDSGETMKSLPNILTSMRLVLALFMF